MVLCAALAEAQGLVSGTHTAQWFSTVHNSSPKGFGASLKYSGHQVYKYVKEKNSSYKPMATLVLTPLKLENLTKVSQR